MVDLLSTEDALARANLYTELAEAYDARTEINAQIDSLRTIWREVVARIEAAEAKVRAFEAGEDV